MVFLSYAPRQVHAPFVLRALTMLTAREHEDALEACLRAALAGESLVKTMREFCGLSHEELAVRTGMPVARFMGEEAKRIAFTDDELDAIATALSVPLDLLMD